MKWEKGSGTGESGRVGGQREKEIKRQQSDFFLLRERKRVTENVCA